MLKGRESLRRLIGKRRRSFFSPLARSLRSEDGYNSEEAMLVISKEQEQLAISGGENEITGERVSEDCAECVLCPVCAASVRGDDFSVNSHLDACLARGKKRKLSQRTLLQVNFFSKPRQETCLTEPETLNLDKCEKELSEDKQHCNFHGSGFDLLHRSCERYESSESINQSLLYNSEPSNGTSATERMDEDASKSKTFDPMFCSTPHSFIKSKVYTLETFIVGRRFQEKIELEHGARVYALRERHNVKDDNAIKVFCDYQGLRCSIGYLPRLLAKYLSPLIDNHHVKFEGSISSLPENPTDAIPIILFCDKVEQNDDFFSDYQHEFESLWEKVLFANESARPRLACTTNYQRNFRLMLDNVMNNHSHLFTNDEKHLVGCFSSLSDDAQRLFIRLYTRKGPWFRLSSISYEEISDLNAAIDELRINGYLFSLSSGVQPFECNMKEVLEVLTVSELQQISNRWLSKNGIRHGRKQEFLEHIISASENGACPLLQKMVLEHVGNCVMISFDVDAILWRIQRLFFLNGEQDLSAFLLVDIGMIKYPEYVCTITQSIFKCRTDLLEYEEVAIEVAQIMDDSIDENNMEMTRRCIGISNNRLLPNFGVEIQSSVTGARSQFFSFFSASWIYSKVLALGVSVYERERRYDDATKLLRDLLKKIKCDSRRGYWTLRLSINLEHRGNFNESLSVAEEGVGDPWIRAGSKMALQRRILRLGKPPRRWKMPSYAESVKRKIKEVTIVGRPLDNETGVKNVFYGCEDELCGVEQLALQYYAEEGGGWRGVHSESGIWMTIFGLLLWDAIFSDVPDVFRSMFQIAPLDLLTDDFYVARKSLIESQLEKIHNGMAEEMLITSWQLRRGTSCRGVNWDRFALSDLRAAVSCIGGRCLAPLCRLLAMDYRSWSSGMPDLLLWRFHGGDSDGGEAKLVEVKGPRDRLSEQQRAWILILMECGFDAEVCRVRPPKS